MRSVLILILFLSFLRAETLTKRTVPMMGTLVSMTLPEHHQNLINPALLQMRSVEKALSTFDTSAETYRLNDNHAVIPSALLLEALELSRHYHKVTEGYFDITVGSITKKGYRFGMESERTLTQNQVEALQIGWGSVKFSKTSVTTAKNISLDFGGMGKGLAVDKAVQFLQQHGVREGVVAASGDIRCLGNCQILLQSPFENGAIGSFETVRNVTAISTSGIYERYIESQENNHLINPNTKKPQLKVASVTLIADLPSSDIDAFATAVSVMPQEKALAFLKRLNIAYIFIYRNGKKDISENIADYVSHLTWYE